MKLYKRRLGPIRLQEKTVEKGISETIVLPYS